MDTHSDSYKFYTDLRGTLGTQETTKCNVCGEEFEQFLHAKVTSGESQNEYYACPRCLSRVEENKPKAAAAEEEREEEEVAEVEAEAEPEPNFPSSETAPQCQHYLGYLKNRSRNSGIPEDCLTCTKMIECM